MAADLSAVVPGARFGKLVVLAPAVAIGPSRPAVSCLCDCGATVRVGVRELARTDKRRTRSCGCLRKSNRSLLTHGMTHSPEYQSWRGMVERCNRPGHVRYADYGGRGISVCARWRESFEAFYADMGPRPAGMTLDRIDNGGNYEPGNCKWSTPIEQRRNRRPERRTRQRDSFGRYAPDKEVA